MHRYRVRYIERDGHSDAVTVLAHTKGEARQKAAERGCEDILKVRRIGFPVGTFVVLALILVSVVFLLVIVC